LGTHYRDIRHLFSHPDKKPAPLRSRAGAVAGFYT
jgi:hypothetical protein